MHYTHFITILYIMDSSCDASLFVSKCLDSLGYNYDMIRFRQWIEEDCDRLMNRYDTLRRIRYTTGGKIEGTKTYYQSDFDFLYELKYIVCVEDTEQLSRSDSLTLFQLVRENTPPGYAVVKLVSLSKNKNSTEIIKSLFRCENGSLYLSSELFIKELTQSQKRRQQRDKYQTYNRDGPSLPESDDFIKCDKVTCIRCFNPDNQRFILRDREHGFPAAGTLQKLAHVACHLVPVGFRESVGRYKEWRLSFAIAEQVLIRNLNETQLKVYIILKLTARSILKPFCEEMTSYIMKNVVLWNCEMNGYQRYTGSTLLQRLIGCIRFLKECISNNYLPSYIDPRKNLFADRLKLPERQRVEGVLSELLNEGGSFLLRCNKLKIRMTLLLSSPETVQRFAFRRDVLEKLVLLAQWLRQAVLVPGISRGEKYACARQLDTYRVIESGIDTFISVDERELIEMGISLEEIDTIRNRRLKELLS